MPRLPYVDLDDADPRVRETLEALPAQLNVFRMIANAQSAFRPFLAFGGALLGSLELDPRVRELVILRVARLEEAEYEWVQHAPIARGVGATAEQVAALERDALEDEAFDAREAAALRFTTEVVRDVRASDDALAAVREHYPPRQIVELMLVIGQYMMIARIARTAGIELDEPVDMALLDAASRRGSR